MTNQAVTPVVMLQNEYWQVGILPGTGASIAFGRVQVGDRWRDVMRPTAEADYGNSSKCSSFIMLPWCNRIKDAVLRFEGSEYVMERALDNGTARHGDVRQRQWTIEAQSAAQIRMSIDLSNNPDRDYPFAFSAQAEYRLDEHDFVWVLTLKNEDTRPMPGGFGHHPYFVRSMDGDNAPILTIPCSQQFELENALAVNPPVPIHPEVDFRHPRPVVGNGFDHVLTRRDEGDPARLEYPAWDVELLMYSDPIFKHFIVFTPAGGASVAVEPMSNVNDAFNLYERGIQEAGVFVLQPGESISGEVRLTFA
ncbi:MAG TPA: hypothetical protein VHL11_09110 [Phototrophicaceae bacterium]|jgi:aldose 1-epimerase|nr:hypothetical protein [Phototrophicaceae bacterium]